MQCGSQSPFKGSELHWRYEDREADAYGENPVDAHFGDLVDGIEGQLQTVAAPDEADDLKERDQDAELFTYITDRSFLTWIVATHKHINSRHWLSKYWLTKKPPSPNSSKPANPELPQNKETITPPVTGSPITTQIPTLSYKTHLSVLLQPCKLSLLV